MSQKVHSTRRRSLRRFAILGFWLIILFLGVFLHFEFVQPTGDEAALGRPSALERRMAAMLEPLGLATDWSKDIRDREVIWRFMDVVNDPHFETRTIIVNW